MRRARRRITFFRPVGCARHQTPFSNARRAFSTARSTSSFLHEAIWASTSPVAGLIVSNVPPAMAGVDLPPMTAFAGRVRLLARAWYSSSVNSDDILGHLPAGFAFDGGDHGLQRANGSFELSLLVIVESAHRLSDRSRGQAGKLAAEFDALNKLPALFQRAHQREEGRHDPSTLFEVLLDCAGVVESQMLGRQTVSGPANPPLSAPGEELQRLIV